MTEINNQKPKINYKAWAKFLSYYRYYIDRFAENILGFKLFPFQRFTLRCAARYKEGIFIWSRGLSKSFTSALLSVCYAILYPGSKIGIVAPTGKQSRKLIVEKIIGELMVNDTIANEIADYSASANAPLVTFKNGSEIFNIVLGVKGDGDSARGSRCNILILDEAAHIKDNLIATVLIPMAKNRRPNLMNLLNLFPDKKSSERNKIMYLSSAWLKTSDLYKRVSDYYKKFQSGDPDYFVTSLSYKVGEYYRIYEDGEIEKEKEKPEMTHDKFLMEYEGVFVGSSNDSYYPYEITQKCRVLKRGELQQPKNSVSRYILMHDVAVSGEKTSDNCATHIIKIQPKPDGTLLKDVVYSKTNNGMAIHEQRDMIRELFHIKFPNVEKIVIDAQNVGEGLISALCETWSYIDNKGNIIEYPPLIEDDNLELQGEMPDALPIIRGIHASAQFNNDYYPYMKACLENESLRFTTDSVESDADYKDGAISVEEQAIHIEQDYLMQELSNIAEVITENNVKVYRRIVPKKKRDRATSLMYGLSYIHELEIESKAKTYKKEEDDDWLKYLGFY